MLYYIFKLRNKKNKIIIKNKILFYFIYYLFNQTKLGVDR